MKSPTIIICCLVCGQTSMIVEEYYKGLEWCERCQELTGHYPTKEQNG